MATFNGSFDDWLLSRGYVRPDSEDSSAQWLRPNDEGGLSPVRGEGVLDDERNAYESAIYKTRSGDQITGPGGARGFWFSSDYPGAIPESARTPMQSDGQDGFFVSYDDYRRINPNANIFKNNEFGDFARAAGLAFGAGGLISGAMGLGAAGTYGDSGLMAGAEGGFDVGMGGATNSALGLGEGAAGTAASTLPESYWSMTADGGGVASDAASANAGTIADGATEATGAATGATDVAATAAQANAGAQFVDPWDLLPDSTITYTPTAASFAGLDTASGSALSRAMDWLEKHPVATSMAGGFIKGAFAPSPQEQAEAVANARTQAEEALQDFTRRNNSLVGVNVNRLRPSGVPLVRPGIINAAMARRT